MLSRSSPPSSIRARLACSTFRRRSVVFRMAGNILPAPLDTVKSLGLLIDSVKLSCCEGKPPMSAAGASSATKKTCKLVLSAAALTAALDLGTAAVIFGPAVAINREPDQAAQLDPRQRSQLVQIAVAKPAVASEQTFTGIIAARVQSNLGFRVPGKVVERLVDVGQEVHAGQPLMRLDQKDLTLALAAKENAVAAARAAAVQARDDEVRYRQLAADGWTSRQRYEQAKA